MLTDVALRGNEITASAQCLQLTGGHRFNQQTERDSRRTHPFSKAFLELRSAIEAPTARLRMRVLCLWTGESVEPSRYCQMVFGINLVRIYHGMR